MSLIVSPIKYYNNIQLEYFSRKIKTTMVPVNSPYVNRHTDELIKYGNITKNDRLLDVGCGMGKYTLNLLAKGYNVEGLDLNPFLLQEFLRFNNNRFDVRLHAADIIDAPDELHGRYDFVIGFMTLHHLHSLENSFRSMLELLKPGGKIIFLEPNPFNPLFHLQIWFTKGMSYKGEKGLKDMTRGKLFNAMDYAGFTNLKLKRFGLFPPGLYNIEAGKKTDHIISEINFISPLMAFQLISGEKMSDQ